MRQARELHDRFQSVGADHIMSLVCEIEAAALKTAAESADENVRYLAIEAGHEADRVAFALILDGDTWEAASSVARLGWCLSKWADAEGESRTEKARQATENRRAAASRLNDKTSAEKEERGRRVIARFKELTGSGKSQHIARGLIMQEMGISRSTLIRDLASSTPPPQPID